MYVLDQWYAVRTRTRFERHSRDALIERGYEVVLPTYSGKPTRNDGTPVQGLPLFPGYLFCRLTSTAEGTIVGSPGVIGVVEFGGRWAVIDKQEVEALRLITASHATRAPLRYVLEGDPVRIQNGPLRGLTGILISEKKKLVVSVTLLQRSVAVVLDKECHLAPINE